MFKTYTAAFAIAICAPAVAAALMDQSVVSVLGAPDTNCSSSCTVGGFGTAHGPAPGGYYKETVEGVGSAQIAGRLTGQVGQGTGHEVFDIPGVLTGSISGNTSDPNNPHGHCTGDPGVVSVCG
jgi:hypothetical protein